MLDSHGYMLLFYGILDLRTDAVKIQTQDKWIQIFSSLVYLMKAISSNSSAIIIASLLLNLAKLWRKNKEWMISFLSKYLAVYEFLSFF